MSAFAVLATFGLALGLGLAAPSAQQAPVFRSGIDLVTVDVTVVDDRGRPVEALGPDRFRVQVDGRPRRVAWAEFVPHRASRPTRPVAHFGSNAEIDPGRLLLIAVDQAHIRRVEGLAALRAAGAFIDALDASDRVAAAPLSHTGPIQFTNEHASVKRYLETLTGTASPMPAQFNIGLTEALAIGEGNRTWLEKVVLRECGESLARLQDPRRIAEAEGLRDPCPTQVEQESRGIAQEARTNARQSLNALLGLIGRMAEIDGPKTLVFVSEGLVAEPQLIDLTALGAAAQAARVSIYVLQLEIPIFDASDTTPSPTLHEDAHTRADGLARLAGSARGALFRLVGADPYPFRRILQELSGYYLVAFEASPEDRDGRTHRIEVSADARGATVRARPAFRITAPASQDAIQAQIVRLLRSPRLVTELPLRVAAYAFRDARPETIRVLLNVEMDGASAGAASVGFVLVNTEGVIAASGTATAQDGRLSQVVKVPAGQYVVRAAAVDGSGRQGSVERTFDAGLRGSGQVRLSDLVLSDEERGRPLRPAISAAGARRIGATFEVYAPPEWKPDAAAVTVRVTPDSGTQPVVSVVAILTPAGPSRWRVTADVPLADVPRGSHVVSATLSIPGEAEQKIEMGLLR